MALEAMPVSRTSGAERTRWPDCERCDSSPFVLAFYRPPAASTIGQPGTPGLSSSAGRATPPTCGAPARRGPISSPSCLPQRSTSSAPAPSTGESVRAGVTTKQNEKAGRENRERASNIVTARPAVPARTVRCRVGSHRAAVRLWRVLRCGCGLVSRRRRCARCY